MASITTDKRTGGYLIRAYAGTDPDTGKRRTASKTLPPDATPEEIAAACELVDMKVGKSRAIGRAYTIGGLVAYYLDCCEVDGKSPTTLASYKSNAKCYVYPHIGDVPFDKAEPSTFANLYRKLRREGAEDGGPLSASTVKKLHAFLSGCFSTLCAEKVVDRNPVRGIKPPSGEGKEAIPLSKRDMEALVTHLEKTLAEHGGSAPGFEDECFAAAWWTCLHTGVRRAELAGFTLRDLDLGKSVLSVRQTIVQVKRDGGRLIYKDPKSRAGKRNISVDAKTRDVVIRHLALQARVLAAHDVTQGQDTPLFARSDGSPIPPSVLTARFGKLSRDLSMDAGVHLHTLRHTHATYLLEQGTNIRTVQERLGHSKIDVTLGIYGHVLPGRDQQAADDFGEVSGGVVKKMHSGNVSETGIPCPLTGRMCYEVG